jgi:hypothetical protein
MSGRLRPQEAIETQLRSIHFLEAQVSSKYGRVPWRILPAKARASFSKFRSSPQLLELLNQVFDSLPEQLCAATSAVPRPSKGFRARDHHHKRPEHLIFEPSAVLELVHRMAGKRQGREIGL